MHHACHSPVHFAPDEIPSRLQPLIRTGGAVTPIVRMLSIGDSHTVYGARYNTSTNNFALTARSHWSTAGVRMRRALAHGRNSYGTPNAQSRLYCYGAAGARLDQIETNTDTGLPKLIADYGAVASSSLVVLRGCGNDFAAGASLATVQARMTSFVNGLLAANFAAIVIMSQGPRLYSTTPVDETVVLPKRLGYNSWLENTFCPSNPKLYFCNINDIGEDPGNPGYALASKFDTLAPGHCYDWVASRQGQALANVIATIPGVSFEPAWADASFFSTALNATAQNPNGNPLLTGTGTEGSPTVCYAARIQVDSGTATWAWSTVTRNGRTVKKLDILTNTGVVSFQSAQSEFGGLGAFAGITSAFDPATESVYGTVSLEGEPAGWAFTEIKMELLQWGGSYKTAADQISDDNGGSGVLEVLPRSVLSSPPMLMGGTVGCNGRLKFRGTGTVYLDWMTVHSSADHLGPYRDQFTAP
ncbi:hypothetical protein OJ996_09075 [Luteolibacter sp. GHJ8]|uniref:SGNH hydrolase-type esterase domain-containing protein n=1 Tax=Luteolibacter rhizosphaerae TaxID=2989719 RepID=A0ABT3G1L2_9BACT|nr:hypothetical protein [Luteolibacter rhizosphaerae]MCW1913725.1 hypothetical protein [Luteolibacter rhizosphaerae]